MGLRQRQEAPQESQPDADGSPNQVEEEATSETKECRRHGRGENECCRTFFASRLWKCITLAVVGFTPVFGVVVAVPEMLASWGIEPWTSSWLLNYSFSAWLATQFLYNFIATQWTDPGSCKRIKPPHEVTGQFEVGGKENDLDLLYAPNWCAKCKHWKPPRSHHCSQCSRCVLRMDHHCPFTGNCIGARNHGHFILFYFFAVVGLSYCFVMACGAAYSTNHISRWTDHIMPKFKENQDLLKQHFLTGLLGVAISIWIEIVAKKGVAVLVQLAATCLAFIPVLMTGFPACQMAWGNVTTMERIFPMKEYVQLKEQVYCPLGPGFYRLSARENLKTIMGQRWWMRLFLPVPGQLDMDRFLMPPPSQEGIAALKQRAQEVKENGVKQQVKHVQDLGFDPGPKTDQTV
mmetsp:Transcript_64906/g.79420  ORF Transcript_64906/g.79420 Transcript_64906/m.79420 type:complete len:405 (+) Transcript_64906:70-1284(+)